MQTTLKSSDQAAKHNSDWTFSNIETSKANLNTVGFTCLDTIIGSQLLSNLRSEALNSKKIAKPVYGTTKHRQALLADLGNSGRAFLADKQMLQLLRSLFGVSLKLEGDASCFTYYQPGDFLESHLDHKELCKVTVILYLDVVHADSKTEKTGLELQIFGELPSDRPVAVIPTRAGSLIIGLGSANWHKRPTLQNGEFITAITACYS